MAISQITFAKIRRSRSKLPRPYNVGGSQVEPTRQSVTATGASIAIRPRLTAIRRMDGKGQGVVSYF